MSESKSRNVKYALSIFLKFGEVLHIEGVDKMTRDRYFDLARKPDTSMLVEDRSNVRNILGRDIANISCKSYDPLYEKTTFLLEKMLLSESSFGKAVYFAIIKLFVFLAVVALLSQLGIAAVDGSLMNNITNMQAIADILGKGMRHVDTIFQITLVVMYLLAVGDILLGLNAHYYINRAGSEPVVHRRFTGLLITTVFLIVVVFIRGFFS